MRHWPGLYEPPGIGVVEVEDMPSGRVLVGISGLLAHASRAGQRMVLAGLVRARLLMPNGSYGFKIVLLLQLWSISISATCNTGFANHLRATSH